MCTSCVIWGLIYDVAVSLDRMVLGEPCHDGLAVGDG
ncbi:MAG: hypothetical protein RL076_1224 [Chloroflexota bacterium]|jgi:hypothetical protein